jgi:hypothetical protein
MTIRDIFFFLPSRLLLPYHVIAYAVPVQKNPLGIRSKNWGRMTYKFLRDSPAEGDSLRKSSKKDDISLLKFDIGYCISDRYLMSSKKDGIVENRLNRTTPDHTSPVR